MESAWHGDLDGLLRNLYKHEYVYECVVLKTCNRVEIYVVSPRAAVYFSLLQKKWELPPILLTFTGMTSPWNTC